MKRSDHEYEKNDLWDCDYDRPLPDESVIELTSSVREVDVIVCGLKTLKAQLMLNEATGVTTEPTVFNDTTLRPAGGPPLLLEVDELIASLGQSQSLSTTLNKALCVAFGA